MSDLFINLFVKESNDPQRNRKSYGLFSSILGITVNILIASMKLIFGIVSSSIAIIADALNNFSDAGSSVVTFISFKLAAKPADKDHPFGHARIEYICSMAVSFIIMIVGFELFTSSVEGILSNDSAKRVFTAGTFVILALSVLFKLFLAAINLRISKKINSTAIKATAYDSLTDAVSTSAILACGIIINKTGFVLLDSIAGIVISILIMFAGIKILNETKNSLLGEAPIEDMVNDIKETVAKFPDVIGIHDLMVHNYGPDRYFASLHAEVDGSKDIFLLHDTIDLIERKMTEELGISCTIHIDPIETNNETVNELRSFTEKKVKEIHPELSIHDFRTVVGVTHTNLIFDIVIPFELKFTESEITDRVKEAIREERSYCYCVITVDRA